MDLMLMLGSYGVINLFNPVACSPWGVDANFDHLHNLSLFLK